MFCDVILNLRTTLQAKKFCNDSPISLGNVYYFFIDYFGKPNFSSRIPINYNITFQVFYFIAVIINNQFHFILETNPSIR